MRIQKAVADGISLPTGFSLLDDALYYKGLYVFSQSSPFIPVLHEYHDSPLGGHMGELKTYLRLAAEWFWHGMC